MTPERREAILLRDGQCVIPLIGDRSHRCRDKWGQEHDPRVLRKLTVDHIRREAGGRRDDEWCVAMCADANLKHWSAESDNRRAANAYLVGIHRRTVEGER